MIIGIDGNEANVKNRVGVNKYAFEVIWGLFRLNNIQKKHKLIVYLKNKPLSDLPKENNTFEYKVIPGGGLWIIKKLTPHLWKNSEKVEVLFSPSHYTTPFLTIPRVCSIMDLGYLESSGQFKKLTFWQLKYWTAISVFASKKILSISKATKKDIVRHYPFASEKIVVTLLGYDKDKFNKDINKNLVRRVKNKYSIVGEYILYLGTLKPSKNIEGLVDAFAQIKNKFPNLKLVISGRKGWMYESIFNRVRDLKLEGQVVFTDFVEEKDKAAIVAGAKVFALTSFWEGFGLDVLSAMAVGTPVVVSKVGSIPEVAGESGVYVDPKNNKDIAEGLKKILNMSKIEYNKLVDKGFKQVKKFDWRNTAEKTMEVLESIRE